jgi:hypothetical protein
VEEANLDQLGDLALALLIQNLDLEMVQDQNQMRLENSDLVKVRQLNSQE